MLQTVWSYKELRGALQRDGWTKARFQVWSTLAFSLPFYHVRFPQALLPTSPPVLCLFKSAAVAAKAPKAASSPGGFDDSTLPLVDKSLGKYRPEEEVDGTRAHP